MAAKRKSTKKPTKKASMPTLGSKALRDPGSLSDTEVRRLGAHELGHQAKRKAKKSPKRSTKRAPKR